MQFDFSDIFAKYEALAAFADTVFKRVGEKFPDEVRCRQGCSGCCHAIFDLSLVESMYLNEKFNSAFEGVERDRILTRADEAERKQHKMVRKAHKAGRKGEKDAAQLLEDMARKRLRCPLLGEDDVCELYEHRPITCRLYGIPLAIEGKAHTCGESGFEPGAPYPTVNIEKLQDQLVDLSHEIAVRANSKFEGLGTLHVPVATALLTAYNEEYLGVKKSGLEALLEDAEEVDLGSDAEEGEACDSCSGKGTSKCDGCDGTTIIEIGGGT